MTTGNELVRTSPAGSGLVIDRGTVGLIVQQLSSRVELLHAVVAEVLRPNQDYGKIPGTDKPTLYKSGAERLLPAFAYAAIDPVIEDLSTGDTIRQRVKVPIENAEGRIVAVGVGSASTDEEKYRWRESICDAEYDETPEHLRRRKWKRGRDGAYQVSQIRTSPADFENTVLKMAHKRALIAATLLATGASSMFNQDVEDFERELAEHSVDAESTAPAKPPVRRLSETRKSASRSAPTGAGALVSTGFRKVKTVRVFGANRDNHAIILDGDPIEYTTKDAAIAQELEGIRGTDHGVQVRYDTRDWNGKTYHNLVSFVVDTGAQAPAAAPQPAATTPPPAAGDIPFGGGPR